jgi:hypothetical protein
MKEQATYAAVFQATTQMSALLPIADQDQKGWNVSDVPAKSGQQPKRKASEGGPSQ